ncbi:MAG: DUF1330 domain-containing protein [Pseudomonadota bacterium]
MTVYVVVDNDVKNPEPYREYLSQVTPTLAAYGGVYLVRAGTIHQADSEWAPERLVIVAFPSLELASAWVNDPEMAHIHAQRREHADSRLIIVDGVDRSGGAELVVS